MCSFAALIAHTADSWITPTSKQNGPQVGNFIRQLSRFYLFISLSGTYLYYEVQQLIHWHVRHDAHIRITKEVKGIYGFTKALWLVSCSCTTPYVEITCLKKKKKLFAISQFNMLVPKEILKSPIERVYEIHCNFLDFCSVQQKYIVLSCGVMFNGLQW